MTVPDPSNNGGSFHTENIDKKPQEKIHGLCVLKKEWSRQCLRRTTNHVRGELYSSVLKCSLILTTLREALGVRIPGLRKLLSKCFKLLFFFLSIFPTV